MIRFVYFARTIAVTIVDGIENLINKSERHLNGIFRSDPKTVAWIVADGIPKVRGYDHFVRVETRPTEEESKSFHRGVAGRRSATHNANALREAHALALHDLKLAGEAFERILQSKRTTPSSEDRKLMWTECLAILELAENKIEEPLTLLKAAGKLAAARAQRMVRYEHAQIPERAIEALGNQKNKDGLKRRIENSLHLVFCLIRARRADIQMAQGLRYIARQIEKGRRPTDFTISLCLLGQAIVQRKNRLSLADMVLISEASGVRSSEIWLQYHGGPDHFDYCRMFDLAVLCGKLAQGHAVQLSREMALFFVREINGYGDYQQAKFVLPKDHPAIEAIRRSLDHSITYERLMVMSLAILNGMRSSSINPDATY